MFRKFENGGNDYMPQHAIDDMNVGSTKSKGEGAVEKLTKLIKNKADLFKRLKNHVLTQKQRRTFRAIQR